MDIDGEILYGNEWINYDQEYFKITVSEDGIYRITGFELENAGFDLASVQGRFLQLYHQGKQIPMFVSDADIIEDDGFIEFYGKKNRGEIDRHLYPDWEENQLNPRYSNFSDEASYFLTWEEGSDNQDYRLSQIVNDISGNPTAETYYLHTEEVVFSDRHNKPDYTTNNLRFSHFDKSEGFGSDLVRNRTIAFPITDQVNSNFKPELRLRFGSNDTEHNLNVSLNDSEIYSEEFNGNQLIQIDTTFESSLLTPQTELNILGTIGNSDRYVLAFAEIEYSRAFEFSAGKSIAFNPRQTDTAPYFEIDNFSSNSDLILVYDEASKSRLIANTTSNTIQFRLPVNDSEDRKIFVYDYAEGFKTVDRIEKKSYTNYGASNPSFIILTSDKLGDDPIQQYADYRNSEIGGDFRTLIVQVEELYDQYAYGDIRNPISVRNFMQERKSDWPQLEFVFVIGKGLEYTNYRTEEQINDIDLPFYVPTWGIPGADNLMFSEKEKSAPIVPIGRIAARSDEDVSNYLEKVFAHEQIANTEYTLETREWTKNVLHLSGGDTELDLDEQIFAKLGDMEEIIEASTFGGNVITYRKTSADPLQTATSTEILQNISDGQAMITFFGHSGAGTFDFSLEDVGEWQNYERYPIILSMGCHSGNVHGESQNLSLSEDFVLTPDKGAIAFIASSSTATFSSLSSLGPNYYDNFGNEFHNNAIGKSIQSYLISKEDIQERGFVMLNQQLTFHGDPSIKLYPQAGPDYIVDYNTISNVPQDITIIDESYNVEFDVVNLGNYVDKDLKIVLSHYLPDGSLARTYNKVVPAPGNRVRVSIPIVNEGINALGKNRIDIVIDADNSIAERPLPFAEENNTLSTLTEDNGYCYFVTGSTVIPVYPAEFGIVLEDDITFVASGVNAFRDETRYQLQLDTSELFENPLLDDQISLEGGTVKWNPTFDYQDGIVYYWRVTPVIEDEEIQWQSSSFIHLPNEAEGWNQSHYFQFLKNDLSEMNVEDRTFTAPLEFEENVLNLFVPDGDEIVPRYSRANTNLAFAKLWEIPQTGICVVMREPVNFTFQVNTVPGLHGSWSQNSTKRIFFFRTDEQQSRIDLVNFLYDIIPDGYHFFLNTLHHNLDGDLHTDEWEGDAALNSGRSIFSFLESQGAELTQDLKGRNTHYATFITKGEKMHDEVLGNSLEEEVNISAIIARKAFNGKMVSKTIGPSSAWFTFDSGLSNIEDQDETTIDIVGVRANGDKTTLYSDVQQGLLDLSEIPAAVYPYLELSYSGTDSLNRTLPSLDYWRVYHKPAPEAIYESADILEFESDALEQGEEISFRAKISNIIENDMDSLLVRYSITNSLNETVETFVRNEPLLGLENNTIEFSRETIDLTPGRYVFISELNPLEDQIEQRHFNNYAITPFNIKRDRLNPLLDVTFNEQHINNGDVISDKPVIRITLLDENPYLLLDDINDFQVVITHPDSTRENLNFDTDDRISFTPGTTDLNQAEIIFLPEFLQEGTYEFFAQAKDKSGNFSGDVEYRVNFQILFENKITDVGICPNPLQAITDEAFFKFSLQGKILPSPFEIRIYSIDGQLVELIQTDRLGNVLIEGVNLVPWDGTSASGAPLSSGTYFYKFGFIPDHYRNNLPALYFKDAHGSFVIINQD